MPRPSGPTEGPPMKMTSIRLPEDLWKRIQRKAHGQGRYASEIVQELLEKWDVENADIDAAQPPTRGRQRSPAAPTPNPSPTQQGSPRRARSATQDSSSQEGGSSTPARAARRRRGAARPATG